MRRFAQSILCTLAFATIGPAWADEEIIVTATRAPTPAQAVPASVIVIDTEAARARGAISLDQALSEIPSIQAPRTGPLGQQSSLFAGGFESNHTLVLFDGVRIDDPSTPEGIFDAGQDTLADAARIEVVQGPMSALYGSNALGGVVNILPRHGGDGAFRPRLGLAAGSFETLVGDAGAGGTLGRLRYAVTADAYRTGGYDIVPRRIATHTGEADGAESATLTGVFDLELTPTLTLDLLARRREARADYDPGFFGNIDENPEAEIAANDTGLWRLGAAWAPSEQFSLRLSGGVLETNRVVADAGVTSDEYHGERRFFDTLAGWRGQTWTLHLGASSEAEEIAAMSFSLPVVGEQEHWGAFATGLASLGRFNLTGALRHDNYEGFGAQTTWRAGAVYRFQSDARLYAAFGTSYRAPSLYERFVPFFGAAGLRPESAEGWEIGADAHWALFRRENGAEASLLVRSSTVEEMIGFAGFSYANVDRADIDFAEARLTLRPLDWLTARLAYANTRALDASSGQALQRRPRHAWSAELAAERGAFSGQLAWRQVGARRDVMYDDFGFYAGSGRVEAYDIVHASASWAISDAVTVYAAADNVLDATYEPVNGFAGAPASLLIGIRLTPKS